jgi:hypothetical protein
MNQIRTQCISVFASFPANRDQVASGGWENVRCELITVLLFILLNRNTSVFNAHPNGVKMFVTAAAALGVSAVATPVVVVLLSTVGFTSSGVAAGALSR